MAKLDSRVQTMAMENMRMKKVRAIAFSCADKRFHYPAQEIELHKSEMHKLEASVLTESAAVKFADVSRASSNNDRMECFAGSWRPPSTSTACARAHSRAGTTCSVSICRGLHAPTALFTFCRSTFTIVSFLSSFWLVAAPLAWRHCRTSDLFLLGSDGSSSLLFTLGS